MSAIILALQIALKVNRLYIFAIFREWGHDLPKVVARTSLRPISLALAVVKSISIVGLHGKELLLTVLIPSVKGVLSVIALSCNF